MLEKNAKGKKINFDFGTMFPKLEQNLELPVALTPLHYHC